MFRIDERESNSKEQVIFNKEVRRFATNARIVSEINDGEFLLYDFQKDTFIILNALMDQMQPTMIRMKNINEPAIKDLALHPGFWADENAYGVYVDAEDKVREFKVEFEDTYKAFKVSAFKAEQKLLNVVSSHNEEK